MRMKRISNGSSPYLSTAFVLMLYGALASCTHVKILLFTLFFVAPDDIIVLEA